MDDPMSTPEEFRTSDQDEIIRLRAEVGFLRRSGFELVDAISTPPGRDFSSAWEAACIAFGRFGDRPTLFDSLRSENAKLRAVVERLPKCPNCRKTATREAPEYGGIGCDECTNGDWPPLPYRAALLALEGK